MKAIHTMKFLSVITIIGLLLPLTADASRKRVAEEIVSLAYRKSPHAVADAQRAIDLRMVEGALARYGDNGARAFREGGYPLLAAVRSHGDEVVRVATSVPGSARYIGSHADEAMRIAATFGDDGIRVQMRSGRLLSTRADLGLTRVDAGYLAQLPPSEFDQMTRLLRNAENSAVARKILDHGRVHGTGFLSNISRKQILIAGVVTGVLVDQAIARSTDRKSVLDRVIGSLSWSAADLGVKIGLFLALLIGIALGLKFFAIEGLKRVFSLPRKDRTSAGSVKPAPDSSGAEQAGSAEETGGQSKVAAKGRAFSSKSVLLFFICLSLAGGMPSGVASVNDQIECERTFLAEAFDRAYAEYAATIQQINSDTRREIRRASRNYYAAMTARFAMLAEEHITLLNLNDLSFMLAYDYLNNEETGVTDNWIFFNLVSPTVDLSIGYERRVSRALFAAEVEMYTAHSDFEARLMESVLVVARQLPEADSAQIPGDGFQSSIFGGAAMATIQSGALPMDLMEFGKRNRLQLVNWIHRGAGFAVRNSTRGVLAPLILPIARSATVAGPTLVTGGAVVLVAYTSKELATLADDARRDAIESFGKETDRIRRKIGGQSERAVRRAATAYINAPLGLRDEWIDEILRESSEN